MAGIYGDSQSLQRFAGFFVRQSGARSPVVDRGFRAGPIRREAQDERRAARADHRSGIGDGDGFLPCTVRSIDPIQQIDEIGPGDGSLVDIELRPVRWGGQGTEARLDGMEGDQKQGSQQKSLHGDDLTTVPPVRWE